jgi:hypothetical protein
MKKLIYTLIIAVGAYLFVPATSIGAPPTRAKQSHVLKVKVHRKQARKAKAHRAKKHNRHHRKHRR